MNTITLNQTPSVFKSLLRALVLPRSGFKSAQDWPQKKYILDSVTISKEEYKRFADVCRLSGDQDISLIYPHVLASSIHMLMITEKSFPVRLLGAVHLKNEIKGVEPLELDVTYRIECQHEGCRPTQKGLEFDFSTKVFQGDRLVWEELTVYFKRGRFSKETQEGASSLNSLEKFKEITSWVLPKNLGKAYAKVCNDYNPIHTSKTLAKVFGLKRDVAHGMGVVATSLDRIKELIPNVKENMVVFKAPLFLENEVRLVQGDSEPKRFDIYCGKNSKPSVCLEVR